MTEVPKTITLVFPTLQMPDAGGTAGEVTVEYAITLKGATGTLTSTGTFTAQSSSTYYAYAQLEEPMPPLLKLLDP